MGENLEAVQGLEAEVSSNTLPCPLDTPTRRNSWRKFTSTERSLFFREQGHHSIVDTADSFIQVGEFGASKDSGLYS